MPLWKRILIITGFVLFAALIGYLIYLFFFAPPKEEPAAPTPSPTEEKGELPISGGVVPVSKPRQQGTEIAPLAPTTEQKLLGEIALTAKGAEVPVVEFTVANSKSPFLSSDGKNLVTYDSYDGAFYRIQPNGTAEPMTSEVFKGVSDVVWSPKADKAALTFLDDSNIVYDFTKQKQITLPKHWKEMSFSPAGDSLAFKSLADNPDNRWLGIAALDGSDARLAEPLGRKAAYFNVDWSPSNQMIGTFREGIDADRQMVYFIGQNNENFKSMVVEGRGLETKWSSRGDRLLYSVYSSFSQFKPQLWIVDAIGDYIGGNRQKVGIESWAHKCTFSDNVTLYCAIPQHLDEGAGILPVASDNGPDDIYKVDLTTGSKEKIYSFPESKIIDQVIVSQDQSTLFFREKYTNRLFSVTK